jgi:signal peptidase I
MAKILALLRSNWPVVVCMLVVMAGRSSLADHYIVPSGSMEPTLVPGDRVLVDKMSFGIRLPFSEIVLMPGESPQAGEVVIFDSPEDGIRLIKRVVAVAGDRVELRGGRLRINGQSLSDGNGAAEERFAAGMAHISLEHGGGRDFGPTTIPEGQLMVLGDSRGNSRDSRYFGFVEVSELYARATRIFYRSEDGFVWLPL